MGFGALLVLTLAADPPAYSFGTLRPLPAADARVRLEAAVGRDAARTGWADDRAADSVRKALLAAHPAFAAALESAADADQPAPLDLPALLADPKLDRFTRSNLAAAFTVSLAGRKVYEEGLAAAKSVTPEELADPAPFLFHKAVCEHALGQKEPALRTLRTLLEGCEGVPDRYRTVATLLLFDAEHWPKDEKDLLNLAKLMDNSQRRLDLGRAGPQTQAIQKKIEFRLDEKLKEAEQKLKQQQQKQQQQAQGEKGGPGKKQDCPDGGGEKQQQAGGQAPTPMDDSRRAENRGKGVVDDRKLRQYEAEWGKLPEAERKRVTTEFTRDLPPRYQKLMEDYFAALNRQHGYKP